MSDCGKGGGEVSDELAGRLAEVYVAIGPVYRRAARIVDGASGVNGMSAGVRAVLDQLGRDGDRTVPQLAAALELSRQFVQRMVNDALAAGFVDLAANPAHRRSPLARLTEQGRAAMDAVLDRERDMLRQMAGDVTVAEAVTTVRVLHQLRDALGDLGRTSGSES